MRLTRLLLILLAISGFCRHSFGTGLSGTLLTTDGWGRQAWAHGNLIMRDLKTGQVDTLVKGKTGGGVFSPDGRKVAYSSETGNKFNIINIKTRQIEPLSFAGDGDQLSWTQDGILYFVTSKYICRYNISSRHIDTVHTVIGDYSHDKDTTNYYITEGNVANSGERAAFISTKGGSNHVLSIQIGGTEVMMNDGLPSTRPSCQGGISPDGNWVSNVNYTHSVGYVRPFHRNDSIYNSFWSPNGAIWMFRFSRSTNNLLLFHTPVDSAVYLHQINNNRYRLLAKGKVNAWDLYAPGWVLDTIPPSSPTGLHLTEAASHEVHLAWSAPGSGLVPQAYVIERNGVWIGETETTSYTDAVLAENTAYDYTVYGKTNGIVYSSPLSGRYSTLPDREPPFLTAAYSYGNSVDLVFSEPIDSFSVGTLSNYSMDLAVTVSAAALQSGNRIHLTTSVFAALTDSFVHVKGVRDLAQTPNAIIRDSIQVTLIRNFTTSSGRRCEWTFLRPGVLYWYDDDPPPTYIRLVTPDMLGFPMFQTSIQDGITDSTLEFIRFDISRPMEVLIATQYDSANVPGWLKDPEWRRTGEFIEQWNIYSSVFPAGTVSLKGNGHVKYSCFNVLLRPVDSARLTISEKRNSRDMSGRMSIYPNPFNPSVNISVTGWTNGTELKILDISGRVVADLTSALKSNSRKTALCQVSWNASGYASGIYIVLLKNGRMELKRTSMLIR